VAVAAADDLTQRTTTMIARPDGPGRTPPRPDRPAARPRARWGTVHATVAATIDAPRDRVLALFLDWTRWPQLFPATIAGVRLLSRDEFSVRVEVDHRRDGHVPNELWTCAPGVIELRERKPRYEATFLNRFEHAGTRASGRTCYTVEAEVRFRLPYALLAPLLRGVVERALRRFTLEPVRHAAERMRG
jgi:hypothetical protein